MVAKKRKAMKDNISPGMDGIPPKLLMELVEQITIPFARVIKKVSTNVRELQTSEFNISDL